MKNEKRTDRRVEKTKKAIKNAFAKLISEKGINDITVKDVALVANINRKTFYNYYKGLYQVINEIEEEISDKFERSVSNVDLLHGEDQPYRFFEDFTKMLDEDGDFYSLIINDRSEGGVMSKIIDYIKTKALKSAKDATNIDVDNLKIAVDFAVSGMVEVYRSWFQSGRRIPPEKVSRSISTMCASGFIGMLIDAE